MARDSGRENPDGPLARLERLVDEGRLRADPAQRRVCALLDDCHRRLVEKRGGWFRRPEQVPGLYIHGGVGRGKTLLMDLFVRSLEAGGVDVVRQHFHRFMDGVHARLKQLPGRSDPLVAIAAEHARRCRVVCFDEFHVEDIADAMLLGELTKQWFRRGMTLVATSNQAPGELYAGGLQRRRFEPAIEEIQRHCRVVELDAAEDYRLRELSRHPTWYAPRDAETERLLREEFDALSPDGEPAHGSLRIRGRELPIRARSGSVLWADFGDLCGGPRSTGDYIELTFRFSTLILSGVPALDDDRNDEARRFMHLVDECYDRAVKLIASADTAIEDVYAGRRLAAGFRRTVSRLVEMQSAEYLARPHRP
ncbi:MAG: cell division protein ZapE [Wenzhouxiangellaceae bacterium]|nr:cell division protein ZapE [Wenzhouxiangellaceae bacterium]